MRAASPGARMVKALRILAFVGLVGCGSTALPSGPADGGTGIGSALTLDPASIAFFGLPINSIRFGISGRDPNRGLCATIIWDYSNTGMSGGAHCDDFRDMFPYVSVFAEQDGTCPGPPSM